ncbi:MAG: SDR family oxidoreductase [Dehalococcoidia bacterium]
MQLSESVALVTGASKGLGLEVARAYAERGAKLVIAARRQDELEAAASELRTRTDVVALALDVSEEAERLVAAGRAQFGGIDVLVNNASTIGPSPMPRLDQYDWRELAQVFRVNVLAPLHLAQLVLPDMRKRGDGVIINVTSDAGVEAYPGWGGYGASKAALEHVSRTLAAELETTGVRVYAVDPGDMNTEMHQWAEPDEDLSGLPGPQAPVPEFVRLVEVETAPFARVWAQAVRAA